MEREIEERNDGLAEIQGLQQLPGSLSVVSIQFERERAAQRVLCPGRVTGAGVGQSEVILNLGVARIADLQVEADLPLQIALLQVVEQEGPPTPARPEWPSGHRGRERPTPTRRSPPYFNSCRPAMIL